MWYSYLHVGSLPLVCRGTSRRENPGQVVEPVTAHHFILSLGISLCWLFSVFLLAKEIRIGPFSF